MKRILLLAFATGAFIVPVARADDASGQQSQGWTHTAEIDVHYIDWNGNRGDASSVATKGSGDELVVPMSLSLDGTEGDFRFDVLGRSGFVYASQRTAFQSGSLSTLTDTVLSGTMTDLAIDGVQPFVSLNLNLPTGRTVLLGDSAAARMDPDIVDVGAFGEGFNTGVTLGANIPFRPNLIANISAGYIWRGDFDRETPFIPFTPQPTMRETPGDVVSVSASLSWQGSEWYLSGSASFLHAGEIKSDGAPELKPGDSVSTSFSAFYQSVPEWSVTGDLSWSYGFKNQFFTGSIFVTEPENSNSNVVSADLAPQWNFAWGNIGPRLSFLYRDHDAYQPPQLAFSPAKTRISVGGRVHFAASDIVGIDLSLDHIWTNERNLPSSPSIPVVAKSAFVAGVATTISF